ncbi:MAG: hypothetical protein HY301_00490 [Verrucomicrobia bacterium]|nr:hypothetical protein [Verrucomicrobiota bacterium]
MSDHSRPFLANPWNVLVILAAVFFLLVFVGLPCGMNQSYRRVRQIKCLSDLKQIGLVHQQWAMNHDDLLPMNVSTNRGGTRELVEAGELFRHFLVLSNELLSPKVLKCATDTNGFTAQFSDLKNNGQLSYFLAFPPMATNDSALLAGDRNIRAAKPQPGRIQSLGTNGSTWDAKTMHRGVGNFLFRDGSVRNVLQNEVDAVLSRTGEPTNRIILP